MHLRMGTQMSLESEMQVSGGLRVRESDVISISYHEKGSNHLQRARSVRRAMS